MQYLLPRPPEHLKDCEYYLVIAAKHLAIWLDLNQLYSLRGRQINTIWLISVCRFYFLLFNSLYRCNFFQSWVYDTFQVPRVGHLHVLFFSLDVNSPPLILYQIIWSFWPRVKYFKQQIDFLDRNDGKETWCLGSSEKLWGVSLHGDTCCCASRMARLELLSIEQINNI